MPSPSQPRRPEPVPITYLAPNPWQPRQQIEDADLSDLVMSIQRHGFIGHLEVRHDPSDPQAKLQLIFGHRRLRAAELVGLTTIPVRIVERPDQEMLTIAYLENSTQLPLSYWDEAAHFGRLRDEFGITIRDLAVDIGRSKGYVQNRIDLLKLPEDSPIREAARDSAIDLTAALTLRSLSLTLPQSEIVALLAQLRAGTLSGSDLTGIKVETMRRAEHENVTTDFDPTGEQQRPSTNPQADDAPEGAIHGMVGVGRFADLVLPPEPTRADVQSNPSGPRPFPCGQDDDWLIATGQLHPDGTISEPVDPGVQAAKDLLQRLRRQVPKFEHLALLANTDGLSPADRIEFAKWVRQLLQFVEAVRTIDTVE